MPSMNDNSRRPLKVRSSKTVKRFAQYLSQKNISPNSISIASVFFALLSAICFFMFAHRNHNWLLILAALFIQCRLLCNLFDGLVAVEGGKKTRSGELFNDIPDRISDPLILVASGYAINNITFSIELGWLAGILAVMTAYIRTLNVSIGAPADYSGPMAKQQRMAILTAACILTVIEHSIWSNQYVLFGSLLLIVIGSIITTIRRTKRAYRFLEK